MNTCSKRLLNWNSFKQGIMAALLLITMCLPAHAQDNPNISLNINSTTKTDKGFVIKGEVIASNLNPAGQIVEDDDVAIIVDIATAPNAKMPLLPSSMYIRPPAGSETVYTKGSGPGGTMTKEEYYGINVKSIRIAQFPLRKSPVWKAYGGLGEWSKKAPAAVRKEFLGIIPSEYEGKTVRIRAMLTHRWGGPYANWPAFHYANDVAYSGVLKDNITGLSTNAPKTHSPKGEATITAIKGDEVEVDIYGNGHFVEAKEGMALTKKSVVITGMDSQAVVSFGKRGKVTVKELSNFTIEEFYVTKSAITAHTSLKGGDVDVKVDYKWIPIDFSVSTPTCIAGVRGTIFHVSHDKQLVESTIAVSRGKVEVTPVLFSAKPVILSAGQQITVGQNHFGPVVAVNPETPTTTNGNREVISSTDAYVYAYNYRNWNRSNLGKYDQLRAGWHPTGGESRAYIKFDLSNVDPSKVTKAVLKLYHFQTAGNDNVDLGIYRVTGSWKEGTDTYHSGRTEKTAAPSELSWVQQPPIDTQPITSFNPGRVLGDWVEVDITPLVKQWLSSTPNYGLVIKPVGSLASNTPASVYHFASRERRPDLENPKGESKAPTLILFASSGGSNAINHPSQTIKSTFSCENKENVEKGCCCFKGTHTYNFPSQYVSNVIAQFDTGRGLNCSSNVNLDVNRGNGWQTVKTFPANSSRGGNETAPTNVLVPVNGNISGFRIADGCACCIDASKITLNANHSGGTPPRPPAKTTSKFQSALAKPCAGDKEFVRSLYQSVLDRDLEVSFAPGHRAAHLHDLQNGIPRWRIIWNFFNSPEYKKKQKNHHDFIRDVYQAVFGREPQGTEINDWPEGDRNDILRKFFNSDEYLKIKGNCKNRTQTLNSGTYRVEQGRNKSTWTLRVSNGQISGTSEWPCCPGHRVDTMKGTISGNKVVIERDCSGQGWSEVCRQTYKGTIKGDRITGSCSGTGLTAGDTWVLQLN